MIEPATEGELEKCPFCEGREDRTPPEVLAIAAGARQPNASGWTVRVVPNLYPAFRRHEVVVHSPRHVRSFAELDDAEIEAVSTAWRQRMAAAARSDPRDGGRPYVHALVNEGKAAGASLAHSHSQLVWLDEPPPVVAGERESGACGVCEVLAAGEDLGVARYDEAAAVAHPAGRVPYEVLIAAAHGVPAFDATLLFLLRDVVGRLHAVAGPVPWNAWLHQGPALHPHVELVPRLTIFAGVELGAGIYVNTLRPEDAAEALRAAYVT